MKPTLQRIHDAELARTGTRRRAWARSQAVCACLAAIPLCAEPKDISIAPVTATRRPTRHGRRAASVTTPDALAQITRDLNIADATRLSRLVRTLNAAKTRTRETTIARHFELITGAFALLRTSVNEPVGRRIVAARRGVEPP